MISYSDLLNVPYKEHGRTKEEGFDCYGLVLECARRNGTPLKDAFYRSTEVNSRCVNDYISNGINVEKIEKVEVPCIVECSYRGHVHVGFMVSHNLVLHAIRKAGVKVSNVAGLKVLNFYRIKKIENESNDLQDSVEQK